MEHEKVALEIINSLTIRSNRDYGDTIEIDDSDIDSADGMAKMIEILRNHYETGVKDVG